MRQTTLDKINNLINTKVNRLTVLKLEYIKGRRAYLSCLCSCGRTTIKSHDHLKYKSVQSCGKCIFKETNTTHGMTKTRLYNTWRSMHKRCYNINNKDYPSYGGRGIKICDEWRNFEGFKNWALNEGYTDSLTIDRIDNNRGYLPENCRWVGLDTQANNKRSTIYLEFEGERHSLSEWAKIKNIKYQTLLNRRYRGLSVKDILKA